MSIPFSRRDMFTLFFFFLMPQREKRTLNLLGLMNNRLFNWLSFLPPPPLFFKRGEKSKPNQNFLIAFKITVKVHRVKTSSTFFFVCKHEQLPVHNGIFSWVCRPGLIGCAVFSPSDNNNNNNKKKSSTRLSIFFCFSFPPSQLTARVYVATQHEMFVIHVIIINLSFIARYNRLVSWREGGGSIFFPLKKVTSFKRRRRKDFCIHLLLPLLLRAVQVLAEFNPIRIFIFIGNFLLFLSSTQQTTKDRDYARTDFTRPHNCNNI